jgi:quinol monooxygenase YgiN
MSRREPITSKSYVTVLAFMTARPGTEDVLQAAASDVVTKHGLRLDVSATTFQNTKDSTKFVFHENFIDQAAISRTRSREPPKLSREAEAIEDPLVLLAGVGTPIEREPIVPPGVGELAQLQHGDGHSWSASPEPLGNVLFRPEEIHVASSEDDVFPPRVCRDQAMEAHRLIAGLLPSDRYR